MNVQAESEEEASEYGEVVGYTPPHNGKPGYYKVIPEE